MRGCEKKVIFLRHPDSKLFEEAYFVMKRDVGVAPSPADMVAEAERILLGGEPPAPTTPETEKKPKGHKRLKRILWSFAAFLLGAAAAAVWLL